MRQDLSKCAFILQMPVTPTWGVQSKAQRQACHSEGPNIQLEEWVTLMKFSKEKCKVLHLGWTDSLQ